MDRPALERKVAELARRLANAQLAGRIERRILSRMHSIRDMGNRASVSQARG